MFNERYTLPTISFIGGSTQPLRFNLWSEDRVTPFETSNMSGKFAICNYSDKGATPLVSIVPTINDGVCYVTLTPAHTKNLFGKYIYQITLKNSNGTIDIPNQGIMEIGRNIDVPGLESLLVP